jgi:hypothetical protein
VNKGKGILLLVEEKMAMLNALKNKVESTETKVEYSPNNHDCYSESRPRFQIAYRSLLKLARMLKWQMKDIVAVIKSIFAGGSEDTYNNQTVR